MHLSLSLSLSVRVCVCLARVKINGVSVRSDDGCAWKEWWFGVWSTDWSGVICE